MSRWPRRLLMIAIVAVWLFIMLLPTMAFRLSRNGQMQLGASDGRHWRLFLLQDADAEGLGLERARPVGPPVEAPSASCLRTTVTYWMWVGEGLDTAYCTCVDPDGNSIPQIPPACIDS